MAARPRRSSDKGSPKERPGQWSVSGSSAPLVGAGFTTCPEGQTIVRVETQTTVRAEEDRLIVPSRRPELGHSAAERDEPSIRAFEDTGKQNRRPEIMPPTERNPSPITPIRRRIVIHAGTRQ